MCYIHSQNILIKNLLSSLKITFRNNERLLKISALRKEGCFYFNTKNVFNQGQFLVTRRSNKHDRIAADYHVCPTWKGFYSKKSIRRHYKVCNKFAKAGDKSLSGLSRLVHGEINRNANAVLKNQVFPKLRNDNITSIIKYDDLAIIYGNKLCDKYRKPHLYYFIRSKLRLIGRLMLVLKSKHETITDFASIFEPKYYNEVIEAIQEVALFDENLSAFKSPATAFPYGTLLKMWSYSCE